MPGMDALSGGVPGGRRVSARWSVRLRWTALGLCITGMFLLVAVLILPWPMGEGSLRTWIPAVYAFRTPALVLLAVGLSLAVGILVAKAFSRSGRTDSAPLARWGLAWLCLSALVFPVAIVMGYDSLPSSPCSRWRDSFRHSHSDRRARASCGRSLRQWWLGGRPSRWRAQRCREAARSPESA